jgi:hypothetical protein
MAAGDRVRGFLKPGNKNVENNPMHSSRQTQNQ